jgi:hypothetical protein
MSGQLLLAGEKVALAGIDDPDPAAARVRAVDHVLL